MFGVLACCLPIHGTAPHTHPHARMGRPCVKCQRSTPPELDATLCRRCVAQGVVSEAPAPSARAAAPPAPVARVAAAAVFAPPPAAAAVVAPSAPAAAPRAPAPAPAPAAPAALAAPAAPAPAVSGAPVTLKAFLIRIGMLQHLDRMASGTPHSVRTLDQQRDPGRSATHKCEPRLGQPDTTTWTTSPTCLWPTWRRVPPILVMNAPEGCRHGTHTNAVHLL